MRKVQTFISPRSVLSCTLAASLAGSISSAGAWGLNDLVMQNMALDQQFDNQLYGMMANTQTRQQQLLQSYIQMHGPQLEQAYQQYVQATGVRIPFEQFVYYHMMTAGGTNAAPALQQQQQNFQALQQANRGLQQGYGSYNQGWWNNSRSTGGALDRYGNEAVLGNAPYANPSTGETYDLPYGNGEGYYGGPGGSFYQDPSGQYHELPPGGFSQPLYPVDQY